MEPESSLPYSQVPATSSYTERKEWLGLRMLVYLYTKRFGSKIAWANRLRLFSSQTFSHTNTPTFLNPSHSSHLPAYEDGRDRVLRNVGI